MEKLKSDCNDLITQMDNELMNIRLDYPRSEQWAKKSIPLIETYLEKLKFYILVHPFKKRREEIYFFKYVKPVVMGKMIFMCEVHNMEVFRPKQHTLKDREYLLSKIEHTEDYFIHNEHHYYYYYKEDMNTMDSKFFVRKVENRLAKNTVPIDIDPVFFNSDRLFSTGFDYTFARVRGMELLLNHLDNELEVSWLTIDEVPKKKLIFPGTHADFVEMVEILYQIGMPPNPKTNLPYTIEELYQTVKRSIETDLPDDMDFNTLKLISGNSDMVEKLLDSFVRLFNKWKEEERDVDYDNPDEDEPKT